MLLEERKPLGTCPKCGGQVLVGKFGPYCSKKCGMGFSKFKVREAESQTEFILGVNLKREQLESLLTGKRIYVEKIPKKSGGTYAVYLTPKSVVEYSYEKDGKEFKGYQYFLEMEKEKGGKI